MRSEMGLRDVLRKQMGRASLGMAIFAACALLLSQRLAGFDTEAMTQAFQAVSGLQWAIALGAVSLSYLAVGQYDVVVLRALGKGWPQSVARRSGIVALAISQTAGMGLLSGALVRWRMMPGIGLIEAFQITLAVGLSFLMAAGFVSAAVFATVAGSGFAWLALGAGLGCAGLCLWRPRLPFKTGWAAHWVWPNLFTVCTMLGLAAIDIFATGFAFWVLLPEGSPGLLTVLPAFLLALIAGLLAGTPAGLGAFEVVLLAALPPHAPEAMLAAVMAWRLVYFAVPSVIALGALARARPPEASPPAAKPTPRTPPWAEAGLLRQGHLRPLVGRRGDMVLTGQTGHSLIGLGAVEKGTEVESLRNLARDAKARGLRPAHYKARAIHALIARKEGWFVWLIGHDAIVVPDQFCLSAPACAGLRRKLRKVRAAGVAVQYDLFPDMSELSRISADWAARHGGEKGFSMGRFCPTYLAGQRVYTARVGPPDGDGQIIAFVSFHRGTGAWALDLMRQTGHAPDGTMHALVAAALCDAQRDGVAEVSLAAVPLGAFGAKGPLHRAIAHWGNGRGLVQFKAAFNPVWRPLYLIARGRSGGLLAAASLVRAIHRPPALPQHPATLANRSAVQDDVEGNTFASERPAWHWE